MQIASSRSVSDDSAISEKLWTGSFIAGTLVNFTIALNYFMLMVIMTAYALEQYNAPASAAAFCASIFIVGTLFARFITSPFMTRFGSKCLLNVGALLLIVLTAIYLFYIPFPLMFALRFLHGMAYGVCSTTIATVVTGIVPKSRKGEGIGYFMLSVTLGSAIGPFAGIYVSHSIGYEALFAIALVVAILVVPCIIALRKNSIRVGLAAKKLIKEAEADIAGEESDAPEEQAREMSMGTRISNEANNASHQRLIDRFIELKVVPISVVCGIVYFGYSGILTFLTPYAAEIGLSKAASIFFVIYAFAMFITRPFTGKLFDRSGAKPVMIPAFFSFSVGMIVLALATNDWMILGAALLLGFGIGTIQSSGLSVAVRMSDDERLSVTNATFYVLLDTGVGIGPLILGAMVPIIGYSNMYIAMAAVGIIALLMFLAVCSRSNGNRQS